MKSVTIGFSKARSKLSILSWIIRKVEGTEFSHVYMKLKNGKIDDLYYHASGSRVNFMGSRIFNHKNITIEEVELDVSNKKYYSMLNFAIDKVGEPYSISQLFGILIVRLFALFNKNINNPFGKRGYVCTELVGEILNLDSKKINKELNSIGLKDIKKFL